MNDNEYRNLLLELYKENQKFLDKATFAMSATAIPFLLLLEKISSKSDIGPLLTLSLIGFLSVIVFQMSSLQNARDGCDKNLGDTAESKKKGNELFMKAKKQDCWKDRIFIFSLGLAVFTMIVS